MVTQFLLKVFRNFADIILLSAFFGALQVNKAELNSIFTCFAP